MGPDAPDHDLGYAVTRAWNEYVLEVVQEFEDGGCLIDIRHIESIKEAPPLPDNLPEPTGPPPESSE